MAVEIDIRLRAFTVTSWGYVLQTIQVWVVIEVWTSTEDKVKQLSKWLR